MNPAPSGTGIPRQIGPYHIEREIARGGMGIVYLARDTRLDRVVAIKALPDDVAADPERLGRFEREAKVLASLNHPNIAGIYGVEESGGRRYLALEHVEGETLAARLARGPLPLGETLETCAQIAAGVEAAHESGVIHRDLKPGNVMITPGDHVKVLDFGLAKGKVAESERGTYRGALPNSPTTTDSPAFPQSPTPLADSPTLSSPTLPHSPTIHAPATLPGVILGTAAYLSPEQARGKAVDRRTDIWSFGCVLYECFTGKRAFEGETVSDTIAKILVQEVDWPALPKQTPPRIRELLRRCLEKDPRKRLRDIGEARLALEEVRAGATGAAAGAAEPATPPGPIGRLLAAFHNNGFLFAAGLILGALLGLNMWGSLDPAGRHARRAVARLSIPIPPELRALGGSLIPNGRAEVVRAEPRVPDVAGSPGAGPASPRPRPRIYVRLLDKTSFEPIRGTEGALGFLISHDGRWIVFSAPLSERTSQVRILKVPLDGSAPPVPIADWRSDYVIPPAWFSSGDLFVAVEEGKAFVRIPSSGEPLPNPVKFDAPGYNGIFAFGKPLPGDRHALLRAVYYERGGYHEGIGVVELRTGKAKLLVADGGSPRYASTGHLLYARSDVLYAAPFDLRKLAITGESIPVMDDLRVEPGFVHASFDLSENGTLQIAPGGATLSDRHAVIVSPGGAVSEWSGERRAYEGSLASSPDGTRFAGVITGPQALYEIWVSERGRRVSRRVIAVANADCTSPRWSPDGSRIAYIQMGQTDVDGIYVAPAVGGGAPRLVFRTGPRYRLYPRSWSPDGKHILALMEGPEKPQLASIPASPTTDGAADSLPPKPEPLFGGGAEHNDGSLSPDGQAIAFVSDESGKTEVHVCAWSGNAPAGEPLVVSDGGGIRPRWSRDGRRLYYATPENKILSVSVTMKPKLSASAPSPVWDLEALRIAMDPPMFDLLPDGTLLGMRKGSNEDEITRFDLTLNLFEELKQRFAAAKR